MATKVSVLYDFDGDTQNGELVIREGDVLTVTDKDVGEGWWEGLDNYGNRGLFPASYVEEMEDGPPSRPPPAPSQNSNQYLSVSPTRGYDQNDGDWEDEWDDASSAASDTYSGDYNFNSSNAPRTMSMARAGTVKKSMNRFSTFVKSGGEAFLLGTNHDVNVQTNDKVVIEDGIDGIAWRKNHTPFICNVSEPEKKSKYKGIKSYVAYQIVPSHTNQPVAHRFKHFDWLYGRFVEKFPCVSVPPLPDKQITGRYAEEFIEKRRQLLEKWMNRVSRHPVLAISEVFQHFITCDSEAREKEWKAGKRKAECDKLVGSQFFYTITCPGQSLSQQQVEHKVEQFKDFFKGMDDSVKVSIARFEEYWDKVARSYRNEYKRFGTGFLQLSSSFAPDTAPYSLPLTQAIEHTGKTYDEIGDLCQDQPRQDVSPMIDLLREYTGMLSTFPDIVVVQRSAMSKLKECQKLQEEERMEYTEVADVASRVDVMTNCLFAEINHFQRERVRDFKAQSQHFIREQIRFHQEIINKLQSSLDMYDHIPDD